ncbi:MAG: hypothetical protein Q7V57_10610 [Actinomycetota bacterium]|nr:hypothetical protein [Actinomycetota bacterium]
MTDEELIAAACPIIRDTGWAFYFAPATVARGAELGLDPVQFYAMGRGGVLGDVEPAVVSSSFGYFNPAMVAGLWNAGKQKVAPRVAAAAFMECSAEHGRAKLAGVPALGAFVAAGEKVLAACDGDAFALFAGTAAEPAAADAPGRAMQLLTILREYRGSAHLVAIRAVGLDTRTAHFAKRPDDIAMFGWSADDAPTVDDGVHAKMADAEALTDRLVTPAYAALPPAERAAFVATLQACQAALTS